MKKLVIALLSISMLAAVAGCGDDPEGPKTLSELEKFQKAKAERTAAADTKAKEMKDDVVKLAKTYSDIGYNGYNNALIKAKALKTAVDKFATLALATTEDITDPAHQTKLDELKAALKEAQDAWIDSRYPYLQTEVFRFYDGPIDQNNPYYDAELSDPTQVEPLVNAWPMDESYLDYTCKYSGMPGPEAPQELGDNFRCNPLHMKLYPNCKESPDATFTALSQNKQTAAKANNCYLPEQNPKVAGKDYATANMKVYEVSFIGAGTYDSTRSEADKNVAAKKKALDLVTTYSVAKNEYSLLSDAQKKELQKVIRGYGGGDPIAGQEYGNGDPNGKPIGTGKHHIPQGEANVSTGFHAIEFLLWGQDFDASGPGSRAMTDFVPNSTGPKEPNAARRLIYLQAITDMLVEDLTFLTEQWKDGVTGNYREDFNKLAASTPRKVVSMIFTGMNELSVSETGGERIQPALKFHNQEEEHSCFSDNTQADMQYDIQGIMNVWLGHYKPVDPTLTGVASGTGMKEILTKYAALCKDPKFKEQSYCKSNPSGYVDVEGLNMALQKALDDATNLLTNQPGGKSFDQEVLEFWPVGSSTKNKGYEKLKTLGDDLTALGPWYAAFASIIQPENETPPKSK